VFLGCCSIRLTVLEKYCSLFIKNLFDNITNLYPGTKWKRQTAVGMELLSEAGNLAAFQRVLQTNPYWAAYAAGVGYAGGPFVSPPVSHGADGPFGPMAPGNLIGLNCFGAPPMTRPGLAPQPPIIYATTPQTPVDTKTPPATLTGSS